MKTVYVAGSALDIERVKEWTARLRSAGVIVTSTWIENVTKIGDSNPRGASQVDRQSWAAQCIREVARADILWSLVPRPDRTTRGAWFEAGYAYAAGKRIVFSGDTKQSIFCALGDELFTYDDTVGSMALAHYVLDHLSDEAACRLIIEMARAG